MMGMEMAWMAKEALLLHGDKMAAFQSSCPLGWDLALSTLTIAVFLQELG